MTVSSYIQLVNVVESALFNQPRKTEEELRDLIGALAKEGLNNR